MLSYESRTFQAFIIYLTLLLDNILLTVIVPFLPDYLSHLYYDGFVNVPNSVVYKSFDIHYVPTIFGKHPIAGNSLINFTITSNKILDEIISEDTQKAQNENLGDENSSIGILLAAKALVQLLVTPIVGHLTNRCGYRLPIVFGTICLLMASLAFAIGVSYYALLFARALQGIASSCIGVCGMSLVAWLYPEEEKRSKVMGIVLGSIALGVLLGYPFGGILYDFVGKSAPFYILSIIIFGVLVLQLCTIDLKNQTSQVFPSSENSKCCTLLSDAMILKVAVAIFISTSAMAILEPCLPIWLMENLRPKIGLVFIPDSIGYFIGTNFFGSIAYKIGQITISIISLIIVGFSCLLIPSANSVIGLLIPHFCLGLGIGTLDTALIPKLASLVDAKYNDDESTSSDTMSSYGSVYALQQIAVSLAYSLGPIFGGEMARYFGFYWLMLFVGILNISYGLMLLVLPNDWKNDTNFSSNKEILLNDYQPAIPHKRFYSSIDVP